MLMIMHSRRPYCNSHLSVVNDGISRCSSWSVVYYCVQHGHVQLCLRFVRLLEQIEIAHTQSCSFPHLIKSAQEEKDRAANLLENVSVFARFRGEIVDNFAAWQKASIASSVTGELKLR